MRMHARWLLIAWSAAIAGCSSQPGGSWTPDAALHDAAGDAHTGADAAPADAGADAAPADASPPDAAVADAADAAFTPDRSNCSVDPDKTGVTNRQVLAGGKSMTYVGFAPASYDPYVPMTVVLSLHGAGDTAGNYFSAVWQANAETRGFLVISPEGTSPAGSGYTYSPSDLEPIVNQVMNDFSACYSVNPKRRIVHGFSAGGILAYLVGLQAAYFFAGISVSAADLGTAEYYAGGSLLPAAWKIPVSHTHGLGDANFPITAARAGRDKLMAAGHPVYWHEFDGGHTTNAAYALQMYDDLASSLAP
jgi:poly(3-hydroxybutyrate) depolymerase